MTPAAVSPGIPPADQPDVPAPNNFDVRIPDVSARPPPPPVQIPYEPDTWATRTPKAPETPLPKLLVVDGSEADKSSGATHTKLDGTHDVVKVTQLSEFDADQSANKKGFSDGSVGRSAWEDLKSRFFD